MSAGRGGRLRIALAIATTGRSDLVGRTVADIARQARRPDRVLVVGCSPADFAQDDPQAAGVELLIGPPGLPAQRNAALEALRDEDLVLFLDDDFVMAESYVAELEQLFLGAPDVVAATGRVVIDGIHGPGLDVDAGLRALAADRAEGDACTDVRNAYGCNMAFRLEPIRAHGLRFDERLPLYAWLEDVDFSRRIVAHGRCVRSERLRGVHLGHKRGRTSGERLGYSQIANPVYLVAKGALRPTDALRVVAGNVAANVARSAWPEAWVDRRGRLRGNVIAFADLARGRLAPERVLSIGGRHG